MNWGRYFIRLAALMAFWMLLVSWTNIADMPAWQVGIVMLLMVCYGNIDAKK